MSVGASERGALSLAANRAFLGGLTRAFGGAIVFSLPILLTNETWQLAVTMGPVRLALFVAAPMPLLYGLARLVGFERTRSALEGVLDVLVAVAVAVATAASALYLLGVLRPEDGLVRTVGTVAIHVFPACLGALLARSELGQRSRSESDRQSRSGVFAELQLMAIGALFLSLPVAPTEEIQEIALRLAPERTILLALATVGVMHAFVYGADFAGAPEVPEGTPRWTLFVRFTLPGYAIAALVSAYVLWSFERLDATSPGECAAQIVVLTVPAAIGAAAARLIV